MFTSLSLYYLKRSLGAGVGTIVAGFAQTSVFARKGKDSLPGEGPHLVCPAGRELRWADREFRGQTSWNPTSRSHRVIVRIREKTRSSPGEGRTTLTTRPLSGAVEGLGPFLPFSSLSVWCPVFLWSGRNINLARQMDVSGFNGIVNVEKECFEKYKMFYLCWKTSIQSFMEWNPESSEEIMGFRAFRRKESMIHKYVIMARLKRKKSQMQLFSQTIV